MNELNFRSSGYFAGPQSLAGPSCVRGPTLIDMKAGLHVLVRHLQTRASANQAYLKIHRLRDGVGVPHGIAERFG